MTSGIRDKVMYVVELSLGIIGLSQFIKIHYKLQVFWHQIEADQYLTTKTNDKDCSARIKRLWPISNKLLGYTHHQPEISVMQIGASLEWLVHNHCHYMQPVV